MKYKATPNVQACPAGLLRDEPIQAGETATVDVTPERADLAVRCCYGLKVELVDKKSRADEQSD